MPEDATPGSEGKLLPAITTFTKQDPVRYADDDDPDHVMSVFLPDGEGPFPALVLIYGGGWAVGSRTGLWALRGEYYASRGIASFVIDYQLSTSEMPSWPTAIQDVVCAVRHIKKNARRYRIDPDRVATMGNSAGGHLASLVGTLQGDEPFLEGACGDPNVGSRVVLVADLNGPTDLELAADLGQGPLWLAEQFLGATYTDQPWLWRRASPDSYISSDDPVFVIGHGTEDRIVLPEISISFASQLEEAGVETYLVLVEGAGHGWLEFIDEVAIVLEPIMRRLLLR